MNFPDTFSGDSNFSTEEILNISGMSKYSTPRYTAFIGKLDSGETKLYLLAFGTIIDAFSPINTWSVGSSKIWHVKRWVDINIIIKE